MWYVGIDVALRMHRVAVLDAEGERVGRAFTVEATAAGYTALQSRLQALGGPPAEILCGLEATGNLWENLYGFLRGAGYRVVVLNPFQTKRYREVLGKKAKTDDIDALVIAGLLRSGEGRASYVPDDQVQGLRELVRLRADFLRRLQDDKRQALALLQVVFPEFLTVVRDPFAKAARAVLERYPTAAHLQGVKPTHLLKIARQFQGSTLGPQKAEAILAAARTSVYSGRAQDARGTALRLLLRQIGELQDGLTALEAALEAQLAPREPEGPGLGENLQSIPGVGPKTRAVLLAELGDVHRFASATQWVGHLGLYPKLVQSGERRPTPQMAKGPALARQALYCAAVAAIKHNAELRTLYLRKRSQGKSPTQALIVVARKLATMLYSMLKHNTWYEPMRVFVGV